MSSGPTPATPRISVVIPVHNTERFVAEALDSVLTQSLRDIEVVVVDDGSTDSSAAVVEKMADERVVILRNAKAGGPARARNMGIRAARAPYVAFIDSDDVMSAGSLAAAVDGFDRNPSAVMIFGDLQRIDLEGGMLKPSVLADYTSFQALPKAPLGNDWFLLRQADFARGLLYENFIATGTVALRQSVLAETGLFDESLINSEDRDLWFRVSKRGDALYFNGPAQSYRLNPKSVSHGPSERNARNRIEVLRRERRRWSDPVSLRQLDTLIAENFCAIGFARRSARRPMSAALSFARSLTVRPTWPALRSLAGCFLSPRSAAR